MATPSTDDPHHGYRLNNPIVYSLKSKPCQLVDEMIWHQSSLDGRHSSTPPGRIDAERPLLYSATMEDDHRPKLLATSLDFVNARRKFVEAILVAHGDGLSYEEIARIVGFSEAHIRSVVRP